MSSERQSVALSGSNRSTEVAFSISDDSVDTKLVASSHSDSVDTTVSSYRNYEQEARELVKRILQQSLQTYQEELNETMEEVEWPTGENFTIERAEEAINRLVKVGSRHKSSSFTELQLFFLMEVLCNIRGLSPTPFTLYTVP